MQRLALARVLGLLLCSAAACCDPNLSAAHVAVCLIGDASTFLHPVTQSFLDDALWSPLHAYADVFVHSIDAPRSLRAALDAHFAADGRYAAFAHSSSSTLALNVACVTEGWPVAMAARACYRDVLAYEAAYNVTYDWFVRLRTDFLGRAALPLARCWRGMRGDNSAWVVHTRLEAAEALSDGAALVPRSLASSLFNAADDFEACVNASSPEPNLCAELPWTAPQCRWLARLKATNVSTPLGRLFAGKPHKQCSGATWHADLARCADGKLFTGTSGDCATLQLQRSGMLLDATSDADVERGRFAADDYAHAPPPGCVADAAGGPSTPAERRYSFALLVSGRTSGRLDEANMREYVVEPLRTLAYSNTSLQIFDCTDTGLSPGMRATRCAVADTSQWDRLRSCWACASAQGADAVDYIVRMRPDLRFYERISTRFFPPPGCIASRLRSARNPHVPILDTMFSYHFGNEWCETNQCSGNCTSCMLNDDQLGIMDPSLAHPYFNTAAVLTTEAYQQYMLQGGCPAGSWPEHLLSRSLAMHGICTHPITWTFRLARNVQQGIFVPGGPVVLKACANQFLCSGQTCPALAASATPPPRHVEQGALESGGTAPARLLVLLLCMMLWLP